jgi:NAD(P)-dependent dehydrogenase (short-subunit alcohol dehydrogenase family)
MTLEKRVAVITGATGGLGSVVTRFLLERGADVALLDRDSTKLISFREVLGFQDSHIFTRSVDLLDPSGTKVAAESVADRFGRIDILLHLIGGWTGGKTILDVPAGDLTFMLNQHIWTSLNVTQAFVPYMVRNRWGRIVMVTSPFASRPNAKGGPYAIGKSGQEALMLTLSQELKGTGVTANLLQAETIDTQHVKISAPSTNNSSWSTPEELASAILFLLSDEAGTVNGAKIPLYGSY